jgi:hypothetical protein
MSNITVLYSALYFRLSLLYPHLWFSSVIFGSELISWLWSVTPLYIFYPIPFLYPHPRFCSVILPSRMILFRLLVILRFYALPAFIFTAQCHYFTSTLVLCARRYDVVLLRHLTLLCDVIFLASPTLFPYNSAHLPCLRFYRLHWYLTMTVSTSYTIIRGNWDSMWVKAVVMLQLPYENARSSLISNCI